MVGMQSPSTNDENDFDHIVRRAKTDREALAVLYDRYFPRIYRYCQRRLLDCATAEDLAADVFLNIARGIGQFAGATDEEFRRWAYRIATNGVAAHFRQRHRRQALFERAFHGGWWTPTGASAADAAENAEAEDQNRRLLQSITRLAPREQTVITLRFWEELSYEEVGRILNKRPATVRVIASRAIDKLRHQMDAPITDHTAPQREGQT
jgi:RNA polymerase sigma-70 factor, ECF subfamily